VLDYNTSYIVLVLFLSSCACMFDLFIYIVKSFLLLNVCIVVNVLCFFAGFFTV